MSDLLMAYVTTPDRETADRISESLLRDRLAACTNLLPGMESRYHWQGRIESAKEWILIVKTDKNRFEAAQARIVELHPYEVPCVIAWEIERGSGPYLDWLRDSLNAKEKE